jgi:hypothetical protein
MYKLFLLVCLCAVTVASAVAAPSCTPTGFVRDSINLTAALINPPGTVSGDVDGTGCNIVIYYDIGRRSVKNANIHGANYFGVVVNGDVTTVSVDIANSSIHDIGETPFNGVQHGVAVYYRGFGSGTAAGKITDNTVSRYQKGGIVVNGAGSTADVQDNVVTGLGRVDFIAGNGIQVGYGASVQVMRNTVGGNAYTGLNSASSGGILVVGGDCNGGPLTTGTQIVGNTLVNNDVGVFLSNLDASCSAPATATNVKVINNTITNNALTNLGSGAGDGYQAGVSDVGNNDKIINNTISGIGYTSPGNTATFATPIDADVSFTNRVKVHANK